MWLERQSHAELRSGIKDAVLNWPANTVGLLTGDSRVFSLSHSWMVRHYLDNRRVRIVDCAVRFDNIALVNELLRHGLDVDSALLSIDIRRAFTPYQILEAVHDIATNWRAGLDVFYLLAPFKQFFDGDVASDEAAYLLHLLNERLAALTRRSVPILVVERSMYDHAAFRQAYHQLKALAKPLWEVLDISKPSGTASVLRVTTQGESHGTHNRTLQHSNGHGRAKNAKVPQSFAQERPGSIR